MQVFVRIITWSHTDPTLHVLDYIYIYVHASFDIFTAASFLSSPISSLLPRPHSTFIFFIFYFVLLVLFPYFLPFYFLCIVLYSLFFILLPSYSDIFYFIFLFSHPHPHTVSCLLIPNSYNPGAAFFLPSAFHFSLHSISTVCGTIPRPYNYKQSAVEVQQRSNHSTSREIQTTSHQSHCLEAKDQQASF